MRNILFTIIIYVITSYCCLHISGW